MNKEKTVSLVEDGVRLHRWFLRHFPNVTAGVFYKLCRSGEIRVNSKRCRGNEILRSGDVVRIPPVVKTQKPETRDQRPESGARFSLADLEKLRAEIIYNDDDLVAFNKPAGIPTQGGTGVKKSMDKMVAAMFPYDKISLVHRLDKETSGVLIIAKNQHSAQELSREFQSRRAVKEYLALLMGNVSPKSGTIESVIADKQATTNYVVLGNVPGVVSWVRFMPKTGRKHQLRIHSANELHAPIVGDRVYGRHYGDVRNMDIAVESLRDTRNLFLFAHKISFRHPTTGKIMNLVSELPEWAMPVLKLFEFGI